MPAAAFAWPHRMVCIPDTETLVHRIDWLLARGVSIFHISGGEPTIHPGLESIIKHILCSGGQATPDHQCHSDPRYPVARITNYGVPR